MNRGDRGRSRDPAARFGRRLRRWRRSDPARTHPFGSGLRRAVL